MGSKNGLETLHLSCRGAVVDRSQDEPGVERHESSDEAVVEGNDEDEDGRDHAHGEEKHSDRVCLVVIHDIDIAREAVRDAQRCRIKERHGNSQHSSQGDTQHDFTRLGAQNRQNDREANMRSAWTTPRGRELKGSKLMS